MNHDREADHAGARSSAAPETVRGVLFDATGTLLHGRESVGIVYSRYSAAHGVDLPAWRLDDAFKRILASAPPRVFSASSASEAAANEQQWWQAVVRSTFLAADSTVKFDDFSAFFAELYHHYETEKAWGLRAGTREALTDLKRADYRIGIVSNFDQRLPVVLQALAVAEFFDIIMLPAYCGVEKPDPRIFHAALEALALDARTVVYVGNDPEKDLAAAERVGMRSIDPNALETFAELRTHIERADEHSG